MHLEEQRVLINGGFGSARQASPPLSRLQGRAPIHLHFAVRKFGELQSDMWSTI
jgi:hypothetical protein